ncbi:CCA tRNA nucleotidyltransferase [Patescibacteria group bacterium]|nr:CCA tRNA nucleotidyltransferase [Patescibacteria group bacterium]
MEEKKEVRTIAAVLEHAGFEAYLVGGCVRDLLLGHTPKDWDIATNATPDQVQQLFPDSVYENAFGTVGVKTDSEDQTLKIVEVTTYRIEGKYSDMRHPDEVRFASTIAEDLSRRDLTVNAMAMDLRAGAAHEIIDPFQGRQDLRARVIRAVGDPEARFQEDALRILRAVRFGAQLGFTLDHATEAAMKKHAGLLEAISKERIRDEFMKMIMTDHAHEAIRLMEKDGILKYVLPELEEGVDVGQNKHHIYSVFEHNVRALQYAVEQHFDLDVRIASLLHDVGKPRSKRGEGPDCTFYGHQVVGERMALQILDRLRFPKDMTERIALLIREHMFVYDPDTVTDAGARRLVRRVGKENLEALFQVREGDRIGSGVPKAQPYRLRHLKFRIEKVSKDPVSAKMLKVNGADVITGADMAPGPKVGFILAILLEEVLDDPSLNTKEILMDKVRQLAQLDEVKLREMAKFAKRSADDAQTRIEEEMKKKYFVQ